MQEKDAPDSWPHRSCAIAVVAAAARTNKICIARLDGGEFEAIGARRAARVMTTAARANRLGSRFRSSEMCE